MRSEARPREKQERPQWRAEAPPWLRVAVWGIPHRMLSPLTLIANGRDLDQLAPRELARFLEGVVYLNWMRGVVFFIPGGAILSHLDDAPTGWPAAVLALLAWSSIVWTPCFMILLSISRIKILRAHEGASSRLGHVLIASVPVAVVAGTILTITVH